MRNRLVPAAVLAAAALAVVAAAPPGENQLLSRGQMAAAIDSCSRTLRES